MPKSSQKLSIPDFVAAFANRALQDLHRNRVYGFLTPQLGHSTPTSSGSRRTRSHLVADLLPIFTGRMALQFAHRVIPSSLTVLHFRHIDILWLSPKSLIAALARAWVSSDRLTGRSASLTAIWLTYQVLALSKRAVVHPPCSIPLVTEIQTGVLASVCLCSVPSAAFRHNPDGPKEASHLRRS